MIVVLIIAVIVSVGVIGESPILIGLLSLFALAFGAFVYATLKED